MNYRRILAGTIAAAAMAVLSMLPATQAATQEFGGMQVIRLAPGMGWPNFGMQREMPVRQDALETPAGFLEKDSDVSASFVGEIDRSLAKLPRNVISALSRAGYRVTLSKTITQAVPAARNQQVRGYEAHATWDSVYGMFNRTTQRVVMAEKAQQEDAGGKSILVPLRNRDRRDGIVRHEVGHAVDQYLGNLSHTPQFKAYYEKGLKSISKHERQVLSYYLQPGDAGREETFAEIFACLDGYACDRNSDILLKNHFPELVSLIRSKVASIAG